MDVETYAQAGPSERAKMLLEWIAAQKHTLYAAGLSDERHGPAIRAIVERGAVYQPFSVAVAFVKAQIQAYCDQLA